MAVGDRGSPRFLNSSVVHRADGRRLRRPAVVAVERVGTEVADRYGFVEADGAEAAGLVAVSGAVEKPGIGNAPSDLVLLGRYVFPPCIFDDLRALAPGHGGEIQLTDAIHRAARRDGAVGLLVDHVLLDIGMPAGLLEATAAVGLARPDLAPAFRDAIRRMFEKQRGIQGARRRWRSLLAAAGAMM